jgi:hypothetical protein
MITSEGLSTGRSGDSQSHQWRFYLIHLRRTEHWQIWRFLKSPMALSATQTLTTRTHTHPYEYTYANPTPMSTSEGLSTDRSADSPSHQWCLVVDGNVAYHLTHTSENPGINPGKDASTKIWTLVVNVPLNRPTIGLQAYLQFLY